MRRMRKCLVRFRHRWHGLLCRPGCAPRIVRCHTEILLWRDNALCRHPMMLTNIWARIHTWARAASISKTPGAAPYHDIHLQNPRVRQLWPADRRHPRA